MTEPGTPTGRPSQAAHGRLAALVGLALLLAGILVGAVPAAAQNAVGASTPVMINSVAFATDIGADQRLGKSLPQPGIVVATGVAAEGAEAGGLNLFKFKDPTSLRASGWRDGDYFLRNEWRGTPQATWRGNSSLLRQEMAKGRPIFDSYVDASGNLIPTRGFLAAERNVLTNRGWSFDTGLGAWVP